jgi:hypothetical protein
MRRYRREDYRGPSRRTDSGAGRLRQKTRYLPGGDSPAGSGDVSPKTAAPEIGFSKPPGVRRLERS